MLNFILTNKTKTQKNSHQTYFQVGSHRLLTCFMLEAQQCVTPCLTKSTNIKVIPHCWKKHSM